MLRISISLFLSGVLLGLGPCLASCGPLLVSYIAASAKGFKQAFWAWFVFSLARVFVYCILGVLAGIFGQFFISHIYPLHIGKYISFAGGVFILIIGLLVFLGKAPDLRICSALNEKFIKNDVKSIFLFGVIVGVSPCAPLIGIFATMGLMSRNILDGVIFGLSFGVGTMVSPLLILAVLAGSIEKFLLNQKARIIFNRICGIVIIILGILIIKI